jgi:hypothetical protein
LSYSGYEESFESPLRYSEDRSAVEYIFDNGSTGKRMEDVFLYGRYRREFWLVGVKTFKAA